LTSAKNPFDSRNLGVIHTLYVVRATLASVANIHVVPAAITSVAKYSCHSATAIIFACIHAVPHYIHTR